jgi:hypothetical protein
MVTTAVPMTWCFSCMRGSFRILRDGWRKHLDQVWTTNLVYPTDVEKIAAALITLAKEDRTKRKAPEPEAFPLGRLLCLCCDDDQVIARRPAMHLGNLKFKSRW